MTISDSGQSLTGTMNCTQCGEKCYSLCCEGHAYCNKKCQGLDWTKHRKICHRFYTLNGSKILDDSSTGDKKLELEFLNVVVARRAELRILTNEPNSEIRNPVILKLLSENGVTHYPRLELLYGFKKGYEFLKRFDFTVESKESGRRLDKGLVFMGQKLWINSKKELDIILKSLQGMIKEKDLENDLFELFKAEKRNKPNDVAFQIKETEDRYFKDIEMLYAWLLKTNQIQSMKELSLVRQLELEMKSVQDYVASKMKKLHKHRIESDISLTTSSVTITLPDFQDPLLPLFVEDYEEDNAATYFIGQLGNPKHISVIAKNNYSEIVGYVTCSLISNREFAVDRNQMREPHTIKDPNFYFYASPSFETKLFSIFSIDGLHVTEKARGGKQNSVAVLLIYHALYFIRSCVLDSKELGDILVVSDSLARSTMLILKQFGFSFVYAGRAMEWLESDQTKSNLMEEVIYYINNFKAIDERLGDLLEETQVRNEESNIKALELIKKLKSLYVSSGLHDSTHDKAEEAFRGSGWNSFLALTTKSLEDEYRPRENTVFDKEMKRITDLVQNNPTTGAEKRTFMDGEEQGDQKRKKFSASFSEHFMDFLTI